MANIIQGNKIYDQFGRYVRDAVPNDYQSGSFSGTETPAPSNAMTGSFAPSWKPYDIPSQLPATNQLSNPANSALSPYATNNGVSGTLADLFKQNTQTSTLPQNQFVSPSVPTGNAYNGPLDKYLPTVPTGNAFNGPLDKYLSSAAPTVPTSNVFTKPLNAYLSSAAPVVNADVVGRNQQIQDHLSNAPTATTSNTFSDPMKAYLGTNVPTAQQARMTNISSTGLSNAYKQLQDLINNPSALQDSASYKFRVQQGQEALQRSLGAKGMLNSGNRLQDLTKYGQDMGAQEYEAENARRMAMYQSASDAFGKAQATNVNQFNAQQGSLDRQYGTEADLFKSRGTTLADLYNNEATANNQRYATQAGIYGKQGDTLANLYGTDTTAATQRYGIASENYNTRGNTLANLYTNQNQADTARYGIDSTANTNRGNTLADLYKTDSAANTSRYGIDSTAGTQRYGIDTTAGTQRYGIDTTAGTNRNNTLADLYRTDTTANTAWNQNQLGWAENQRLKYTPQPWNTKNYAQYA